MKEDFSNILRALKRVLKLSMPLAEADVRASVHACKGEQRVRSAIVKRIFSAVQEHCPPEKLFAIRHSLFATRCRFWLGRSLALPLHFVPRPASHDPFRSCPVSLVPCPV